LAWEVASPWRAKIVTVYQRIWIARREAIMLFLFQNKKEEKKKKEHANLEHL
jgi:hypothetical protein